MNSSLSKQINSWKELDDKVIVNVHLDQKGLEEHQDWMGIMEQSYRFTVNTADYELPNFIILYTISRESVY